MRKFIVAIDTQVDFMMRNGKLPVSLAHTIITPGIEFLTNLTPENTAGVLFTFDTHGDEYDGSAESQLFPKHCEKGTPGWENVFNPKLIDKGIATFTLEKGVFNMWEEANLKIVDEDGDEVDRDFFFDTIKREHTDTVVIIGVAADYCVKWAIDGFVARGFNVEIVQHLTKGIDRQIGEVLEDPEYASVKLV